MKPLRRSVSEPRVELMPLIDVVFLLLTFFIYSMLLMVRAELLPMQLRSFIASEPARPAPATVISIDLDGGLFLDRDPVDLDGLLPRLREAQQEEPDTVLYLAVADGDSTVDRAPLLQDVWDRLKDAGLEISLVGRPKGTASRVETAPLPPAGPGSPD